MLLFGEKSLKVGSVSLTEFDDRPPGHVHKIKQLI